MWDFGRVKRCLYWSAVCGIKWQTKRVFDSWSFHSLEAPECYNPSFQSFEFKSSMLQEFLSKFCFVVPASEQDGRRAMPRPNQKLFRSVTCGREFFRAQSVAAAGLGKMHNTEKCIGTSGACQLWTWSDALGDDRKQFWKKKMVCSLARDWKQSRQISGRVVRSQNDCDLQQSFCRFFKEETQQSREVHWRFSLRKVQEASSETLLILLPQVQCDMNWVWMYWIPHPMGTKTTQLNTKKKWKDIQDTCPSSFLYVSCQHKVGGATGTFVSAMNCMWLRWNHCRFSKGNS